MDEVRARLAARREGAPEGPEPLWSSDMRRAGVLIPLFVRDGGLWILFTRRTETVEHHRGQISFPGGGEEEDDGSLLETALRETREEIGVDETDVHYLGALSPLTTVTDFYVEPYVGAIPNAYPFRVADAEIAELIEAPVTALLDPKILERKVLPGREEPTLFYHHDRHVIWGATARMLAELLEALKG
jgi:8-oxo-dGTP pyrophosphatase MutT (NUDIX family)